jgi:hypothetical protein
MQDRDLDKVMAKWADEESTSAPRLRPTDEMYRQVVSLGRKRGLRLLFARRPARATAVAAVILVLATALAAVVQLSPRWAPAGRLAAQVPQRAAFEGKGEQRGGPSPRGKGDSSPLLQLVFQVWQAGSSSVSSVDVLASPAVVGLTADDSYRLVLQPTEACYVYVYQRMSSGALALLYPNRAYSPAQNPVGAGETIYLPSEPNGFYLDEGDGAVRLYVVAAKTPLSELDALYEGYSQAPTLWGRRRGLARLQQRLDALVAGQRAEASGWTFEFEVR